MRFRVLAAASAALTLGVTGCAAEPSTPGAVGSGQPTKMVVGYSVAIGRDPTFQAMIATVQKTVEAAGGQVIVGDANFNPNQQVSDIESMLTQGINVLLVAPIDPNGLQPTLAKVRDKKIPIIVQEAKSNNGEFYTNLVTDNFEAASEAATYLAENGGGPAAAIQGQQVADLLIVRKAGFDAGAKAANLQVLDTKFMTQNTDAEARGFADQFKQAYPGQIKGIFAWNTLAAIGAASATSADFAPVIVSLNGNAPEVELVKAGKLAATWSVRPVEYAKLMVYCAQLAVEGKPAPANEIHVAMPRIDMSNAAQWVPWEQQPIGPINPQLEQKNGRTYLKSNVL